MLFLFEPSFLFLFFKEYTASFFLVKLLHKDKKKRRSKCRHRIFSNVSTGEGGGRRKCNANEITKHLKQYRRNNMCKVLYPGQMPRACKSSAPGAGTPSSHVTVCNAKSASWKSLWLLIQLLGSSCSM